MVESGPETAVLGFEKTVGFSGSGLLVSRTSHRQHSDRINNRIAALTVGLVVESNAANVRNFLLGQRPEQSLHVLNLVGWSCG